MLYNLYDLIYRLDCALPFRNLVFVEISIDFFNKKNFICKTMGTV